MNKANVLNGSHAKTRRKQKVISGRLAYRYLDISDRVFFPAVKHRNVVAQFEKRLKTRTESHFAIAYLDEIKKILDEVHGEKRGKGLEVFTEEVLRRLIPINKKWDGKLNVSWAQDMKDTDKVIKSLLPE